MLKNYSGIYCGDRYYDSFEKLGNAMLANLPKKRQGVKWWRVHRPWLTHHTNGMNRHWTVNLPHVSTSRSWVGYYWIHIKLFNRWDLMLTFGHWDRGENAEKL